MFYLGPLCLHWMNLALSCFLRIGYLVIAAFQLVSGDPKAAVSFMDQLKPIEAFLNHLHFVFIVTLILKPNFQYNSLIIN